MKLHTHRAARVAVLTGATLALSVSPTLATTPPSEPAPAEALPSAVDTSVPACDEYFAASEAMDGDSPDPAVAGPLVDAMVINAAKSTPPEVTAALGELGRYAHMQLNGNVTSDDFPPRSFFEAESTVDTFMFEHCKFDGRLDVTGNEYSFTGIPAELKAGTYGVLLRNAGAQIHELGILRRNDGVTDSWADILALPEDQVGAKASILGFSFAPGTGDVWLRRTTFTPGDYLAVCFLPDGTILQADGTAMFGTGVPHMMKGMQAEFHVSA